jgi:exopolyphosphatase/guanosine-5'-triphosphate,3'-diphosphate pyrophosphatase
MTTSRPRTPAPATLAAIDLGSNSFRVELARIENGRYQRLLYEKETVRLGGGLDDDGMLGEAAMRRGLDCLGRFAVHLRGLPPTHVRAVATQTLREARNPEAFLARAQDALAHEIEIISGREEARLIYAGVSHLQPGHRPRLVIDIGGRSTEMILGTGHVPRVAESFAVGSVSLSMRWFGDGHLTTKAFRAAQVAAGAELEESLKTFAPARWQEALGSSGTVSAVSQILVANGISHGEITPAGLRWCIERCVEAGHVQNLTLPGLREDRRPVVAGGLALLYTLCVQFGIHALQPSRGALRQGVILDLHQRLRSQGAAGPSPTRRRTGARAAQDLRDLTVRELQRRFEIDIAHARAVRAAALHLHGFVSRDVEAMQELGWAADLHEIGQARRMRTRDAGRAIGDLHRAW